MKERAWMAYWVLVWLLGLSLALVGCGAGGEPTALPEEKEEYVPVVSVTGELVPEAWATLSHAAGGRVAEVLVAPGDKVASGAPLVRMEVPGLRIALDLARQEVAVQQAALDGLIQGASELIITRADRDHAQQLAQAELALTLQQHRLEQARAQSPDDEVAAAQAGVRQLERRLAQARVQSPSAEAAAAQVELERAQIALDDVQNEYGKALDRPWEEQEVRDALAKQLEQARLNRRLAQAQLDGANAARRAHAAGLEVLQAQLDEAQAMLAQALEAQGTYSVTLQIVDDEVQTARLQVEHLQAWENPYRDPPADAELAQAKARLQQARDRMAQVEQQIDDAEVRAPFAGTVGAVLVRAGETVLPGQALVTVGNLDTLRVETTDLDEVDVVRVAPDQPASVTMDALPDRVFAGRVARVAPMAEPGTGGVRYTAIVELLETDPRLRWGMTAFVDIQVQPSAP